MSSSDIFNAIFSSIASLAAWNYLFGAEISIGSAFLDAFVYPFLGLIGVISVIFKVFFFIVLFVSTVIMVDGLIKILKGVSEEYEEKLGYNVKESEDEEK